MTDYAEHLEKELLAARSELAELRKRVCVPEGWVVVPAEPTIDMSAAARRHWYGFITFGKAEQVYRAMLAAATAPVEPATDKESLSVQSAAQDVAGLFSTNGNENNWPRIGETYLVRLNGVLQKETFEFDQSDDGIGGGEYFWSRPDCDECPAFDPERDEWLAIATLAAHQSGGAK